jgi:DNA-binding MarR family transcriptional regulator
MSRPEAAGALQEYRLLMADVYELAGASRRTSDSRARELGQTAARWHVMSVLQDESLSVAAAARRLGLARQSVQRVVNDLVSLGHVRVEPDPNDRRAPLASLTASGQQSLRRLMKASDSDRALLLERAGITVEQLRAARSTVRALAEALRDS